jgi:hypothetical protein
MPIFWNRFFLELKTYLETFYEDEILLVLSITILHMGHPGKVTPLGALMCTHPLFPRSLKWSGGAGSYECLCPAGYTVRDGGCHDVDECRLAEGRAGPPCGQHGDCTNLPGTFTCSCHPGQGPGHPPPPHRGRGLYEGKRWKIRRTIFYEKKKWLLLPG